MKVTIVSPTYNEAENISKLWNRLESVCSELVGYSFRFLFIDNNSSDNTVEIIKSIVDKDQRVGLIVNNRNFGHIRSPYWGILQSKGDITIYLASDLQDPPELIPLFLKEWEKGYKVVLAVKPTSHINPISHRLRQIYYNLLNSVSTVPIVQNSTGFGLYDACVIHALRKINDPYPFLRGLIAELGFSTKLIEFNQPRRTGGISKNNIYTLYDIAALGLISHSMIPIRILTFAGILCGTLSLVAGVVVLITKLLFWDYLPVGYAPFLIVSFLLFGISMIAFGILGEYIGSIHTFVKNRPIVVEKERVNLE